MEYEEILTRIHGFNVFGSKLGLERMKKLLALLGNPEKNLRIIHIAGTNGKGSVCRYLYTVLNECGYRTGAYFSPYLQRFTERIEFAGKEIAHGDFIKYAKQVLQTAEQIVCEGGESPTEFEVVTAIGLLYFNRMNADFVILEVGLGGRGDSTNICEDPVATAITSISYDHMDRLGDTLEQIAWDKSGIIKDGVPVSVFVEDAGALQTIRRCAAELAVSSPVISLKDAPLTVHCIGLNGSLFSVTLPMTDEPNGKAVEISSEYKNIEISMAGLHQVRNAVCALSVLHQLRLQGVSVPEAALRRGMKKAVQPGRFEILASAPFVILDGAHNIAGIEALTETIRQHFSDRRILLCTGMLADKEYEKMAAELACLQADVLTVEVPSPRTLSAAELAEVFRRQELYSSGSRTVTPFSQWEAAVAFAQAKRSEYDVILWAGSLYLIGAVRGTLTKKEDVSTRNLEEMSYGRNEDKRDKGKSAPVL